MKVKYIGPIKYEFFMPGVPGVWKPGEVREISKNDWKKIKDDKNFTIVKDKEVKHASG